MLLESFLEITSGRVKVWSNSLGFEVGVVVSGSGLLCHRDQIILVDHDTTLN